MQKSVSIERGRSTDIDSNTGKVSLMKDSDIVIVDRLVPWYKNLSRRSLQDITVVVLHATEIPELDAAWDYAMQSVDEDGVGLCGHLYIDHNGSCFSFVPLDRIANHARGHNRQSVGIELVNSGRYPNHFNSHNQEPSEPFHESQIAALKLVLIALKKTCPNLTKLVRHSDIDQEMVPSSDDINRQVRRRIDPGPRFPWKEIKVFWDGLSPGWRSS
jgi:N-acetylmuramoyl-L-alanine amidase